MPIQDEAPVAAAPIAAAALLAPTLSGTISSGAAVSLFTLDGAEIDTAKETWIVIHGWTQNPSSVSHVAHQVAAQRPGAQVLMLDWSAADTGDDAGTLDITPEVGAWAAGALADAGFPAGTVNLVSYSYGVYVATELANAVPGGVDVLVAIDPGYDAPGSAYDPATQGDLSANSKYSLSFYGDEVKGNIGVAQSADEAVTILGSNHNGAYWVVESLLDATDGDGGGADAFFNLSRLLAHAPAGWLPNQFNSSGDNTFGLFDAVLDTTTDGRMPTGIDAIVFTGGDDVVTLFGQALNAHALGGDDTVNGSAVADTLFGDAGADRLEGRDGADILSGGVGADTMIGGRGGDAYYVGAGDVVVEASGEGADSVFTAVNYVLGANVENLTLLGAAAIGGNGNSANNKLLGNEGNNTFKGGAGDDAIKGGGGNDVLYGNAGLDTLTGGTGADTFVFNALLNNANRDTITDFSVADDTIRLDDSIFTALGPGALSANAFQTAGGGAQTPDVHIIYNAANGKLFYDADGSGAGAAIWFASVSTGLSLTHADFLVV